MEQSKAKEAARLIALLEDAKKQRREFMERKSRDVNIVFIDKGGFSGDWVFPNPFGHQITDEIKLIIERRLNEWIGRLEEQINDL